MKKGFFNKQHERLSSQVGMYDKDYDDDYDYDYDYYYYEDDDYFFYCEDDDEWIEYDDDGYYVYDEEEEDYYYEYFDEDQDVIIDNRPLIKVLMVLLAICVVFLVWIGGMFVEELVNPEKEGALYLSEVTMTKEDFNKDLKKFFDSFTYSDEVDVHAVNFPKKEMFTTTVGAYTQSNPYDDKRGLIMIEYMPKKEDVVKSAFVHEYSHHLEYKYADRTKTIEKTRQKDLPTYEQYTDCLAYYITKDRGIEFFPGYIYVHEIKKELKENKDLNHDIKMILKEEGIDPKIVDK